MLSKFNGVLLVGQAWSLVTSFDVKGEVSIRTVNRCCLAEVGSYRMLFL